MLLSFDALLRYLLVVTVLIVRFCVCYKLSVSVLSFIA